MTQQQPIPDGQTVYIVTNCVAGPTLQKSIHDVVRFPWREVRKVQHYWMEADNMTRPIETKPSSPSHGEEVS